MWLKQYKIQTNKDEIEGIVNITFTFFDEDNNQIQFTERVSDPNSLDALALDHIKELNRIDEDKAKESDRLQAIENLIKNPPTDIISLEPPTPTPEEIKKQDIQSKYSELLTMKRNVDLKLSSQETYDALLLEYKQLIG